MHHTHPHSKQTNGKTLKKTPDKRCGKVSRSKSKGKGRQPIGLMERNIIQNLDYYRSLKNVPTTEPLNEQQVISQLFPDQHQLREKPQLNEKSHRLYQKVKRKRNLSPNVFERLKADEENRSKSKLLLTIARIKQVTPSRKIKREDFQRVSTPKEMKYIDQYLSLLTQ